MKLNILKLLPILTVIFICGISVFAQQKSDCPKIEIVDPPVAVAPGENMVFKVSLPKELENSWLFYIWKVNQGHIIDNGQRTIKVNTFGLEDTTITATVKIIGLPQNCPQKYSGAGLVQGLPIGEPVDRFEDISIHDVFARVDLFAADLQANQNSAGLIVSYGPETDINTREQYIAYYMKERDIDLARVIFVNCGVEKRIRTSLWIVPKGVSISDWEKCEFTSARDIKFDRDEIFSRLTKLQCPTSISVLDPPVVVAPGENLTFTAKLIPQVEYKNIGYRWTTDRGEIIEGQGTPTITVSTKTAADTSANATVKVTGLPKECGELSASGSSIIIILVSPIFKDEFGVLSKANLEKRSELYLKDLKAEPTATGYVVIYGKRNDVEKQERILAELMLRELQSYDPQRLVFVRGAGEEKKLRTRLWIVPAGADASEVN